MSKQIPLTQGLVAIVDDEDFTWLSQWTWTVAKKLFRGFYAYRKAHVAEKRRTAHVWMAREIMSAKPGQQVDHRDGNTLNNQRSNLRLCSHSWNQTNLRL